MKASSLSIGLVGPLPPPSGGMANQTLQLAKLLREENIAVELIQVNRPYHPRVDRRFKGIQGGISADSVPCSLVAFRGKGSVISCNG